MIMKAKAFCDEHSSQKIYTASDRACLKIGNESFQIDIPNGGGDGTTIVYVFDKENIFDDSLFKNLHVTIRGKFGIYDYDCGNRICATLSGSYYVYTAYDDYDYLVILKELTI